MTSQSTPWQPISTAPQDGTAVLLFHPLWELMQVGLFDEDTRAWQGCNGDLLHRTPTHWMSLPLPPVQITQAQAA
jgi:hypothetical protein